MRVIIKKKSPANNVRLNAHEVREVKGLTMSNKENIELGQVISRVRRNH